MVKFVGAAIVLFTISYGQTASVYFFHAAVCKLRSVNEFFRAYVYIHFHSYFSHECDILRKGSVLTRCKVLVLGGGYNTITGWFVDENIRNFNITLCRYTLCINFWLFG